MAEPTLVKCYIVENYVVTYIFICVLSIFTTTGQWSEAISEYEAELGLHEALEDTIGAAVACRNLGECYCGLEQFDKALCLQQRHLTLAR